MKHYVNTNSIYPPFPEASERLILGMGCFWGAERLFWNLPGIWVTAVGYAGGSVPNPTYKDVCTGRTGHAEVVQVVFDPQKIMTREVLRWFWESHDPTQGMRQGNDVGEQYRSVIFATTPEQLQEALESRDRYQAALRDAGMIRSITTEIALAGEFHYAEPYHQQYLAKNPGGYCGLRGLKVNMPPVVGVR